MAVSKLDLLDAFLDDEADALALGYIYTYVANSSTPLATYTDSTGNTANDNPTRLDSSGRAHLWFKQGFSYKVIVKDQNLVTKYTEDGITIPSDSASATTYVDIAFEVLDSTPPTTDQILGIYVATEAIDFAIDFAGSRGKVMGTNPAATFTTVVKKNSTTIGAFAISTGGTFTFTTTGGATKSLAVGDALVIYAPTATDASLVGLGFTFRGTAA